MNRDVGLLQAPATSVTLMLMWSACMHARWPKPCCRTAPQYHVECSQILLGYPRTCRYLGWVPKGAYRSPLVGTYRCLLVTPGFACRDMLEDSHGAALTCKQAPAPKGVDLPTDAYVQKFRKPEDRSNRLVSFGRYRNLFATTSPLRTGDGSRSHIIKDFCVLHMLLHVIQLCCVSLQSGGAMSPYTFF